MIEVKDDFDTFLEKIVVKEEEVIKKFEVPKLRPELELTDDELKMIYQEKSRYIHQKNARFNKR